MVKIMDRPRWLSVPINEKGIEEYDYGVEDTSNIKTFMLSEREFDVLYHQGIFDSINEECELFIDDYESEVISKENFETCDKIIGNANVPVFSEALELAKKYDTLLGLDF
jgi:hypothetical protein